MKLIKGKVMGRRIEATGLLDPGPALCRVSGLKQLKENQMLSVDT